MNQWSEWINSLESLKGIKIPRCYTSQLPKATNTETHIFSDASEKAIGAVAYLKTSFSDNSVSIGFLIGKAKLAPTKGHSLPRLELCAAVMAIEIHEIIRDSLDIKSNFTQTAKWFWAISTTPQDVSTRTCQIEWTK